MTNAVSHVGGFQPLRMQDGSGVQIGSKIYAFATSRAGAAIIPGRILIKTGSADSAGRDLVRTAVAGDTDNGSSAVIVGVSAIIKSSAGDDLNIQYADTSTAGLVQCWQNPNIIYLAQMSGVPTAYGGSFALVVGTVSNYDPNTAEQTFPSPIVTDKIDSTTYNATAGYHSINVLGAYGSPINRDTAAAMPAEAMLVAAFMTV